MKTAYSISNPIGHRLKLEMRKRGVTSAELAKRAGVKTSFIYDIISGKSANPSTLKLARVADALESNLSYLVGSNAAINEGAPSASTLDDEYVGIPRVMVDVSAGGGTLVSTEQVAEHYYFRRSWIREHLHATPDVLRMLYIHGDSMEPSLCHNDIILVDTTRKTPSPPGIFVLFDGLGLVAKRLEYISHPTASRIRIISDNLQYSTYERSVAETYIIGRIVWFAREI